MSRALNSTSARFNTQPPEGGWDNSVYVRIPRICFNTQPPEGGWRIIGRYYGVISLFQHTAA